jgi:hypothetical protein
MPFCFTPFALMPLGNLHFFIIFAVSFWFDALWLIAFYYANPLFLMGLL